MAPTYPNQNITTQTVDAVKDDDKDTTSMTGWQIAISVVFPLFLYGLIAILIALNIRLNKKSKWFYRAIVASIVVAVVFFVPGAAILWANNRNVFVWTSFASALLGFIALFAGNTFYKGIGISSAGTDT